MTNADSILLRYTAIPWLMVAFAAPLSAAEPVYKSVDSEGRVTYSSTPLEDAVEVEDIVIFPAPGEERVRETEERLGETREIAKQLEEARKQRESLREEARKRDESVPEPRLSEREPERYPYYVYPYWGRRPHYPHRPVRPGRPKPVPYVTRP